MKKLLTYLFILFVIAAGIAAFLLLTPATSFSAKARYIYVTQGADAKQQVITQLDTANLISRKSFFTLAANAMGIWQNITPGRFEIRKGETLLTILRTFQKNRQQSTVTLNIGRVRTKESLARYIGKNFLVDSAAIIKQLNDSLYLQKFGVDTNTLLSIIIPQTYIFKWDAPLDSVLQRFKSVHDDFWAAGNHIQKAADMDFSPLQISILASIVEEETTMDDDKGKIASVYINRLHKNMALGADPTIKFALKDFSLKRILYAHLKVESPYNTYIHKGLPPGPICTPSHTTLDAVLNAPPTTYLYFVAKSDFSDYHHFSTTFAEHEKYAKEYQHALDSLLQRKQQEKQ